MKYNSASVTNSLITNENNLGNLSVVRYTQFVNFGSITGSMNGKLCTIIL